MSQSLFVLDYSHDHFLILKVNSLGDHSKARAIINAATKELGKVDFDRLRDTLRKADCELTFISNNFAPDAYSSQGEWVTRQVMSGDYAALFFRDRNNIWKAYTRDSTCSNIAI